MLAWCFCRLLTAYGFTLGLTPACPAAWSRAGEAGESTDRKRIRSVADNMMLTDVSTIVDGSELRALQPAGVEKAEEVDEVRGVVGIRSQMCP
jgi:hypothetical protein